MAFISSNLFAPMPNMGALGALSQGVFVPQLTGDIGFAGGLTGMPSWGLGDVLNLTQGPMTSLSQMWMAYLGSFAQMPGQAPMAMPAAEARGTVDAAPATGGE